MAKFVFQFDTLLRHRRNVEDQRQRDMALVLRKRTELLDELRNTQQTIRDSKRSLTEGLVGRVDMTSIGHFVRYSAQAAGEAHVIVDRLAVLERDVEDARLRLLEAVKARKALELLEEKHRQEWQRRQDRLEAEALDELSIQRYARAAMEEGES